MCKTKLASYTEIDLLYLDAGAGVSFIEYFNVKKCGPD